MGQTSRITIRLHLSHQFAPPVLWGALVKSTKTTQTAPPRLKGNEMIEKMNLYTNAPSGFKTEQYTFQEKINELIDTVNGILDYAPLEMTMKAEPKTRSENVQPDAESRSENVQDPYAEQRKWVGKLCWFWDEKEEEKVFGILTTIDSDCGLSDMYPYWNDTTKNWFEHCEPVKDDIIYKGGDNEL